MYPQSMFWSKNKKIIKKNYLNCVIFTGVKNRCILHGHVFVMTYIHESNAEKQMRFKKIRVKPVDKWSYKRSSEYWPSITIK